MSVTTILKTQFRIAVMLLFLTLTLSGCALFKKKCDCPPVGRHRAALVAPASGG